ncbi:MAG TPA: DUF2924 domain-containing protein [Pirellulales bacterium]|jgi:hypothetical protein|nr:DUF2924 domain-containing protein [Pirellulales bacterium]
MDLNFKEQLAALKRTEVRELQARYAELFGERPPTHHRVWLVKRIAWRLQALAEGDLSERARRRAAEIASDADLRLSPPKSDGPRPAVGAPAPTKHDARLPMPGALITRRYKGATLEVKVLADGFQYEGRAFKSLSAVAKAITGTHANGYHFFRLAKEARR